MRDTASYCGILLDDNNRKPICRLYFNNAKKKYIAFIDAEKKEEKIPIDSIDDIYQNAKKLQATINYYEHSTKQEAESSKN